ncbi:hypothetical protein B7463_g12484, partial [Scytalidium lignicola]
MPDSIEAAFVLDNGCRISHGSAHVKRPFPNIDLTMHQLCVASAKSFSGPLGFIEFTTELRLPRHIHMDLERQKLLDERIMVLHGVGIVEFEGKLYAVAPGSLVNIPGGVPHTWTACPIGVKLPGGLVSTGSFTMVYEYEEPTQFFPTASTEVVTDPLAYIPFKGAYSDIFIPKLSAREVVEICSLVFNKEFTKLELA